MLSDWEDYIDQHGAPPMGRPEWEVGGVVLRMAKDRALEWEMPHHFRREVVEVPIDETSVEWDGTMTDYEAIALLHDHAREWCETQNIFIETAYPGNYVVVNFFAAGNRGWLTPEGTWGRIRGSAEAFSDYDRALIAACVAASKADKKADEAEGKVP